ncbi:hypothetical protein EWM64_g358 [Hericium alpestre]|uniref:Uncharacterized protein n=1 Tax=Hericium alpestre TaxID=135208 RepID=A0A4Z0A9A0_9AGAM|nr:hypothetical protein EWM64_g358 [Hericium alpestre]
MVVTRRAPAAPTSRTNSSQAIPRTAPPKGKASSSDYVPSPLADGQSNKTAPHESTGDDGSRDAGDRPKKGQKDKSKFKSKKDGKKRKRKGASLADVLLRYLLLFFTIYSLAVCPSDVKLQSPVCRGLSEYRRLILEPYILPTINTALAHPSIAPHIQRIKPYTDRAVEIATPIVIRTQEEWQTRVVPQWRKRVIPQYKAYVVPQLDRMYTNLAPYLAVVDREYEKYLGPYLRRAVALTIRAEQTAEPLTLKHLLIFLQAQRRQFVDPHVAKIWERVLELSKIAPPAKSTPTVSAEEPSPSPEAAPSAPLTCITDEEPAEPSPEPEPTEPIASPVEAVETASISPVASASAETVKSSTIAATPTIEAFETSVVVSPSAVVEEDIDLDVFAADLGLNDEEVKEPEEETPEAVSPPPAMSEEEIEEARRLKAVETAEKRRELTSRHADWEEKLEALIKESKKTLRKRLVALRKEAVAELKSSPLIRKTVDQLTAEADKFVKGAEAYIKNLKKNTGKGGERLTLWTRVIEKIENKFFDLLKNTEALMDKWTNEYIAKEQNEVNTITEEVKDLAENAQADIGLDYVWLDDVTYQDWQRYHDLLRTSDNFTAYAISVQNGSHPSPPINPVPAAVQDLQSEIEDIILDFETRLDEIKRKGDRALGAGPGDEDTASESASDPEVSILPIPEESVNGDAAAKSAPFIGRGKKEVEDALRRAAEKMGIHDANSEQPSEGSEEGAQTHEAEPVHVHEEL